ncbi:MAG: glycosyltransferase family 9 protein [Terriglobales bacterium]
MAEILSRLPRGAGVAFVRLRSLGDTLLLTPAAAALKAWRPDLRLAILVEPRFAAAVAHNPDFEAVIEVPATLSGRWNALRALRHFRPALALGLHGGSTAAGLVRASGATQRATFAGLRHGWAYNLLTPPQAPPAGQARLHTVEHVLSLLTGLGLPEIAPGPLKLFVRPEARERMRQRLAQRGILGRYAFLSTEAREPGLRWPLDRFGEVAAWLRKTHGLASVQASAGAGEPVSGATLISGTSVEQLMAIEVEAELVVGNDGGPVHIAAALGKPVFALYSTTDIEVWRPWQAHARWCQRVPITAILTAEVEAGIASLLADRPGETGWSS